MEFDPPIGVEFFLFFSNLEIVYLNINFTLYMYVTACA